MSACAIAGGILRLAVRRKIAQGMRDEKKEIDKDVAIQFLSDTFEFCDGALASMTARS